MKTALTTTEKFAKVIAKESIKFEQKGTLSKTYTKFRKFGIIKESAYTLPLKDTIGKAFREQIQFTNSNEKMYPDWNSGQMS